VHRFLGLRPPRAGKAKSETGVGIGLVDQDTLCAIVNAEAMVVRAYGQSECNSADTKPFSILHPLPVTSQSLCLQRSAAAIVNGMRCRAVPVVMKVAVHCMLYSRGFEAAGVGWKVTRGIQNGHWTRSPYSGSYRDEDVLRLLSGRF